MAKNINKLIAITVKNQNKKGRYADGNGLYLQVTATATKSWIFRYKVGQKSYEMGLGAINNISLAEARLNAINYQKILYEGKDPIQERKAQRIQNKNLTSPEQKFKNCAEQYINTHKSAWKNEKHIKQWKSILETYAFPIIGETNVKLIDLNMVLKILEPIWNNKTETAKRLRGRIENILDWAKVKKFREGDNPARWKGNLDQLLAAPSKIKNEIHFPCLPYNKLPEFISKLRLVNGISARALEFAILHASRSGEVRGATWDEINFDDKLWVIPSTRMKANREHRIPLSDQAICLLNQLPRIKNNNYIFPSIRKGMLSDMSLTSLIKRMGYNDITQHGFRSTFRNWAAEQTDHSREVIEYALAHKLKDRSEAAYQRSKLLDKRRILMNDWARYLYLYN